VKEELNQMQCEDLLMDIFNEAPPELTKNKTKIDFKKSMKQVKKTFKDTNKILKKALV